MGESRQMHSRWMIWLAVAVLDLSVLGVKFAGAEEPVNRDDAQQALPAATSAPRKPGEAIESGLSFLVNDVAKWRAERGCATCHHGTMTVWALSEAKAQGYAVPTEAFAEIMQWTKEQMV